MHWLDPDHLPKTEGAVDRFLINPHGDIDGFLLTGGMEVHVPPHLSGELRSAVQPGASVSVFGVRPRHAEMIAAVAIETAPGKRIVDNGPPKDEHKHEERGQPKHGGQPKPPPMEAEGVVQRPLHGPKGEVRGVLLEDGRIIRIPPHEAKEGEMLLHPGARLGARGPGLTLDGVTVIEAKEIGTSLTALRPVKPKKPKADDEHPKGSKHEKGHSKPPKPL